ncbi:MAG: 23S rRNA (adenine(2503)-C(2))-methyltransferase RlmN [Deltaproteobacteria bacterium]|nr:23S rRNA (adenine(2503)-C(2))-methyltransferase RlmN [Candidatus Anaeroferrophillus wilburensis]MBN2889335.1 23S rRNA (adenine(2503)-C(2))-methyltransferase RlmN [Deltaproteobacteria bacterium]
MVDKQKLNLKGLTREQLAELLVGLGKERYRADQIIRWLYLQRVDDIDAMSNLSRAFRAQLRDRACIVSLSCVAREKAADGTEKFLFQLADGNAVEAVLIPEKERLTLCLSTQVGCRQGCRFCVTGQQGFVRNLTVAEIVDQVVQTQNVAVQDQRRISNLVFMGMGEPLDNITAVTSAVEILKYDDGLQFSSRRITLSTCGLVPEIERLGREVEVCLAISLNATTDEVRSQIMPVNRRYPLRDLLAACGRYPLKNRSRITYEYILLQGINDSPANARRLVQLLAPLKSKVNLIPFNEHPDLPFKRPSDEQVAAFQAILLQNGMTTIVRKSKGADITAACGQLRGRVLSRPGKGSLTADNDGR